ncbi:hypothetical protein WMY93_032462 [Mugilogobius chulae]|uniref:Uncharacterized protein n=1 Tax=Mugilogobius chulae TaxID=88201 RepID=A0AAW0MJL4_9GOBI
MDKQHLAAGELDTHLWCQLSHLLSARERSPQPLKFCKQTFLLASLTIAHQCHHVLPRTALFTYHGSYASDYELPSTVTGYRWTLFKNVVSLFALFEQLTSEFSSAAATSADVIPSVRALRRRLSKETVTSKATLLDAVV